jgi:hypothetical protein
MGGEKLPKTTFDRGRLTFVFLRRKGIVDNAIYMFFSVSCLIGIVVLYAVDVQAKCEQLNSAPSGKTTAVVAIGSTIFAGTNTGAYRSTDNGVSWENVNSDFTLCFAARGADIFAGTGAGVTLSTDNGITWKSVGPDLPYSVTALAVIDTNVFAGTYQNGIYRTTDDGTSWSAVNDGLGDFQNLVNALAVSGRKLFVGTAAGLCLSTDLGNSWSTIAGTGMSPLQFTNCISVVGSTIFVGTPGGMIRSSDSGSSWEDDNNGLPFDSSRGSPSIFSVAVNHSYTFAATTASVFLSTDNGESWTAANDGLPAYPRQVFSIAAIDSDVFAGTANGVFVSTNNGTNWKSTITGIAGRKEVSPVGFGLEQNYPNPFNPSTQISYILHEAGKVTLMIYDVLGREIATLADGYQQAGRYTVTWNATQISGVPASTGVYFARLRVANDLGGVKYTKTSRLLLMR